MTEKESGLEASTKRRKAIANIRRHMDEDGRYTTEYDNKSRQRHLDIYRRVMAGESQTHVARSLKVSRSFVGALYHKMARQVEQKRLYQEDPEIIAYSPLPVRILSALRYTDISQFHQLNGLSRKQLAKLPNCGKESINILEAYLEFKFPEYRLID